jgi:ATP-dependent protease Clp ATPase subunit
MILEKLMRELMFTVPSDPNVEEIIVTKEAVLGETTPEVKYKQSA